MKTSVKKWILMPLLSIALICAILFIGSPAAAPNTPSQQDLREWMHNLKDDTRLIHAVLPGSHDAGSFNMMSLAETQRQDIGVQLSHGVRYFDLRARNKNDIPLIFHGPVNGVTVSSVLQDIESFLTTTNEEFLILDFQHFENEAEPLVWQLIEQILRPQTWCMPTTTDLNRVTFGEIREKGWRYCITWGSKTLSNEKYLFSRSSSLFSPYDESVHKSGADALIAHLPNYYARADQSKIFVLQSQLTAPNLLVSPISLEKSFVTKANTFLTGLSGELLQKTNVVMRDFICDTKETIPLIISLNEKKGLWKS